MLSSSSSSPRNAKFLDIIFVIFLCFTDPSASVDHRVLALAAPHLWRPHLVLRDLGEQPFLPAPLRFDSVDVVADPIASEAMSAMDDHGSEPKLVF